MGSAGSGCRKAVGTSCLKIRSAAGAADSAQRAAQLMRDRNVGAILICESQETKRLVGIVTDRDLALRVVAEGCDPKGTCVGDVMTRELFTCRPEDDVQKALELMERQKVRRI